jgi:hypothetical protein
MNDQPGKCYAPRMFVLVAMILSAVVVGLGVGVAYAADPRLDTADAVLQQAATLLAASQSGEVDAKTQREFDRAIARAVTDIASARAEIATAKVAVDSP